MKRIVLCFAAAVVFGLCSCGNSIEPSEPDSELPASSQKLESEFSAVSQSVSAPAAVKVDWFEENTSVQTGVWEEFADYPSDYQVRLLFTTDTALSDFSFLALTAEEADGSLQYETETLYTASSFAPDCPVVIDMTFVGAIPDRGICYTDTDGTMKYFAIGMSGKDGSLLLTEFAP